MIDTHAHLGDDAAEVVARAHEAGVTRIVDVATTLAGAHESLDRADRYDGVYACLGIHPHEAAGPDAEHVDELLELFSHDAQQRLFDAQLGLALEVGKPVVIHSRAADDDTRTRLVRHDGPVILHCFSSEPLLPAALEHGWYVSFAGNVTYKNAYDLRAAARRIPADRLLVETDSPYLAPQDVRGRRNEPAYVRHTLEALAQARGEDAAELERQIDANASAVFSL